MTTQKIVLVTGANRGLGLAIVHDPSVHYSVYVQPIAIKKCQKEILGLIDVLSVSYPMETTTTSSLSAKYCP